ENNEWLFVYLKKPDVISTQLITNLNTLDTLFYAQNFEDDKTIKKPKGAAVFFIVDEQTFRDKSLVDSFSDCFAPIVWLKEGENGR
ncbi:MAG: hypothetical protein Q7T50_02035, partial [Candidatus Magasanikbacteria bacterium]|nr:hypothetical protein [Candidatus Magasanikbacteria bacterium]